MVRKILGQKSLEWDTRDLRVLLNFAMGSDLGGWLNKIYLIPDSTGPLTFYEKTDTGLDQANALAAAGDAIYIPPCTLTDNHTMVDGVEYWGAARDKTILTGEISIGNAIINNMSITRTANDTDILSAVVGPLSGIGKLYNCNVSVAQSGTGEAADINIVGSGSVYAYGCNFTSSSVGGDSYVGIRDLGQTGEIKLWDCQIDAGTKGFKEYTFGGTGWTWDAPGISASIVKPAFGGPSGGTFSTWSSDYSPQSDTQAIVYRHVRTGDSNSEWSHSDTSPNNGSTARTVNDDQFNVDKYLFFRRSDYRAGTDAQILAKYPSATWEDNDNNAVLGPNQVVRAGWSSGFPVDAAYTVTIYMLDALRYVEDAGFTWTDAADGFNTYSVQMPLTLVPDTVTLPGDLGSWNTEDHPTQHGRDIYANFVGVDQYHNDPNDPFLKTSEGTGHVIEDEGTPLTQRSALNFVGAGVTVTDDAGNDASKVTIPGSGGDASSTIVNVSDHGATPDAIAKSDGAMTSGSAVLTSASGEFTADDVGKTIFVGDGAGGSNLPLVTTIQSFTSATEVTLAANAGANVSNAYYIYGTDNTAAFQAALDAAYTIAADKGKVTIQCAAGTYLVNGAPADGGNGELAQIHWPFAGTSAEAVNIELVGATQASIPRIHWQETGKHGTVIQSTRISQSYSSSTGLPSVIGGPASYGPQHGTGWTGFNYVGMVVRDLTIRQADNPWLTGIDGGWMHNFVIERVQMDTIVTGLAATVPSNPASVGVQFPVVNFRGPGVAKDVTVKGYYCAFGGGELLNGDRLEGILCTMLFALTPAYHANRIGFLEDINCIHGFGGLDPSTGIIDVPTSLSWMPGTPGFAGAANIALWSVQDNNGQVSGFNRTNHIKDANSVSKLAGLYTLVTAGGTRQTTGLTFTGDIKYPLVDLFTAPHSIVSIYLNVSDFELLFGSPAKGIQNGFPVWLFDAASIETIGTSVAMPSHWNTYAIYIHWTNNGAGSGNVVWRHDRKSATDGLSFTAGSTTGTPLTVSAPVAGTLKRTLLETGIARSGTIQAIQLARIGSDGADTLGNDASILGVLLVKIT